MTLCGLRSSAVNANNFIHWGITYLFGDWEKMPVIRRERPEDLLSIRRVNEEAFGRREEADLVDALRKHGDSIISLVAIQRGQVVGHILFSPVTIEPGSPGFPIAGLGPMAVLLPYQKMGIGSELVRVGLEDCRQAGYGIVVVLGHPGFYPRFGFLPARPFGIRAEWGVPDDAFMALEIVPRALSGCSGVARYLPEFGGL